MATMLELDELELENFDVGHFIPFPLINFTPAPLLDYLSSSVFIQLEYELGEAETRRFDERVRGGLDPTVADGEESPITLYTSYSG
ncbi:hypothetical protein BC937DRAFT_88498 [Endogone sp. FLAS-F59071]|nr:hypothetical protein BC937DRAFT_88498 [Endogone sp. FLAS-F59071]|eukprot:RUS18639.1 hypothetical protein BC937DRAFT_88498 [Endogone sp. FLAS-F59071]